MRAMNYRRVRTLIVAVLLGMVLAIFVAPQAQSQSATTHELSIKLRRQSTAVWCWAATIAMVVDHIQGFSVQDCEVLSEYDIRLGGTGMCCSGQLTCQRAGLIPEMTAILSKIFGMHGTHKTTPVSFQEVVTEINAGRPLVAALQKPGAGHVVVISGYRLPDQVVVLDPIYGKQTVAYATLRANWTYGYWTETLVISSNRPTATQLTTSPMCSRAADALGRQRIICKSNRFQSGSSSSGTASTSVTPSGSASSTTLPPPPPPKVCVQVTSPCVHVTHPAGDLVPCTHRAHTMDVVPCQHPCMTPWGYAPCHPQGDVFPCSHPAHPVGDLIPCIHRQHPGGDTQCVNVN